jgi:hypothetical protein
MSFFVSDSLKGIITEKDLEAESPIKILEEKENITVRFNGENCVFECELLTINFSDIFDEIRIITDTSGLSSILKSENKILTYSIILDGEDYMQTKGTASIDKLEVNKADNCIVCKIDIFKRGY